MTKTSFRLQCKFQQFPSSSIHVLDIYQMCNVWGSRNAHASVTLWGIWSNLRTGCHSYFQNSLYILYFINNNNNFTFTLTYLWLWILQISYILWLNTFYDTCECLLPRQTILCHIIQRWKQCTRKYSALTATISMGEVTLQALLPVLHDY